VVRRVINRYHPRVNGHFLCDRGRFGYPAVNEGPDRPRHDGGTLVPGAALDILRNWLKEGPVLGIGSPRASLEDNFALQRLVGRENFHLSLAEPDHGLLLRVLELHSRPQIRAAAPLDCEDSDAILVLGEDVTQTAPRLALALRQAVQRHARDRAEALGAQPWQAGVVRQSDIGLRHPLFLSVPYHTRLDQAAHYCHYASPERMARLGFAVAMALDQTAEPVGYLLPAADIAATLLKAERPLIVCGVSCRCPELLEAAEAVALALARRRGAATEVVCIVPECNSLGAALLGGAPLERALERVEQGGTKGLIVLADDLYQRAPAARLDKVLGRLGRLAVIDAWATRTSEKARLVLPAASWSESAGTFVSLEGRAQRFYAVQPPRGNRRSAWRWLAQAGAGEWEDLEALDQELAEAHPGLAPMLALTPETPGPVPREPHRFSGRTALAAPAKMHEPKPPPDPDSPLAHSMEGLPPLRQPPALRCFPWQPGWDSHPGALIADPGARDDSGVRLFDHLKEENAPPTEPGQEAGSPSAGATPGRWRVVPRYHIFGSEPVSARVPAIAARSPGPYVALGPFDAEALNLTPGTQLKVCWEGVEQVLPLVVVHGLAKGVAALPWGLVPWFPPKVEITLEPWREEE